MNPGAFYLLATPPALLFFFYLKQGLTELLRVSLSSRGWLRTWILLSQPPKNWDYKRAPPRPAVGSYLLFLYVLPSHPRVWDIGGIELTGILPLSYTSTPFYFTFILFCFVFVELGD